jgi:hypothetical protein
MPNYNVVLTMSIHCNEDRRPRDEDVIRRIKNMPVLDAVYYFASDLFEVTSAEWDERDFKINMQIRANTSDTELIVKELQTCPLEDTAYEASEDTPWILLDEKITIDYRYNPIRVY